MNKLVLFAVLVALGSPAAAGQPTATVGGGFQLGDGSDHYSRCKTRLEGVLRDAGFQILNPDLRPKGVKLQVLVKGTCYPTGERRFDCMGLLAMTGRINGSLESKSNTTTSLGWAADEVCRKLADKLRKRVGDKIGGGGGPIKQGHSGGGRGTAAITKAKRYDLVFQWKGQLSPMPLIKLTSFFQKAGYQAKMIKSKKNLARFRVELDEPPEQFRSLLTTFLSAHYQVRPKKGGKSRMVFVLKPL